MPFHNNAPEKITKDHVKIGAEFLSIPNFETGSTLGSKSGEKEHSIRGEIIPIAIEKRR